MKDNPKKSEFGSLWSYSNFAKRIVKSERYVWGEEVNNFLDTVLATHKDRIMPIKKGDRFYRAQLGINESETDDGEIHINAYGKSRMKPEEGQAREGRANAVGIPALYLGSSECVAVSEVRPWVGSKVSISLFQIEKNLDVIDLRHGHSVDLFNNFINELAGLEKADAETRKEVVWHTIDQAFSQPAEPSDKKSDYAPTQVLADLFRKNGYDGVVYRSQFDKNGYNIALFDLNSAEALCGTPVQVKSIKIEFDQYGNSWYAKNP